MRLSRIRVLMWIIQSEWGISMICRLREWRIFKLKAITSKNRKKVSLLCIQIKIRDQSNHLLQILRLMLNKHFLKVLLKRKQKRKRLLSWKIKAHSLEPFSREVVDSIYQVLPIEASSRKIIWTTLSIRANWMIQNKGR